MYHYKMFIAVLLIVMPGKMLLDKIISDPTSNQELVQEEHIQSDFMISVLNDLTERNVDYNVIENGVISFGRCTNCDEYTMYCIECGEDITFQWCEDCYHGEFFSYGASLCEQLCGNQN